MLDSLGMAAPLHEVSVDGRSPVTLTWRFHRVPGIVPLSADQARAGIRALSWLDSFATRSAAHRRPAQR